jgi:hypothetical protein
MNIIDAIKDQNLFRPFLENASGSIASWKNWIIANRVLWSLPIKTQHYDLIRECTGRDPALLPQNGFDTALFLTGRRSGKSRISAIIGAYISVLSGLEKMLAKGEMGMVAIIAPTKKQGRIVKNYLRAIFTETPLLQNEIESETAEGFLLNNGILVEIMVGDWRSVRGYTLLAAIVDEVCFFGLTEESKVKNDEELITALKPSLATVKGSKCICISSPYAKKGWSFKQYEKCFGNNSAKTLVWNCPSRTMNPLLPQSVVDEALAEDMASAKAEYLGEFRDDISGYLPKEVIVNCVIRGRKELLHEAGIIYFAFCDCSGGRSDDGSLSIAHRDKIKKVIIDITRRYKAPHSPVQIIGQMSEEIKRFGLREIYGDNYAAQFVVDAFKSNGIRFVKSELSKSELYCELLPRISSSQIELLDDEFLINQLCGLERRTRSGGKDIIDHPKGGKDDVANSVSGASFFCGEKRGRIGTWR